MITCAVRNFDQAIGDIETLIDAQWNEVGSHRDRFTKAIHYEDYRALAAQGRLITVTARSETEPIVGYFIGAMGYDLHRNSLSRPDERVTVVSALAYYMMLKYRGYARSLIHSVERFALKTYNAQIVNIRVKPEANDAGAFLQLLGYTVTEVTYTRLLGEASDARFRERAASLESVD